MPYYCTVPRCTSMAGKAKNVSFHQFPRDEELARLWNKILKRGKPYTKYSKVCSLHFRPEDYTITSVGKNKGQWRTLRKDAIPSQNLPSESPGPTTHRTRSSGAWVPALTPNVIDTRVQQQMAQAIYMQTMLAMQAATNGIAPLPTQNSSNHIDSSTANTSNSPISEIDQLLQNTTKNGINHVQNDNKNQESQIIKQENQSYQCEECTKCFKDPDVFVLHRRTHIKKTDQERIPKLSVEKENFNANSSNRQETLKANPILANLLKNGTSGDIQEQIPGSFNNALDVNNILSIENQIMAALAANVESYIRNLSSMLNQAPKETNGSPEQSNQNDYEDSDSNEQKEGSENMDQESDLNENKMDASEIEHQESDNMEQICSDSEQNDEISKSNEGSLKEECTEPNCDNQDLNESKDSNSLVIDENIV